MSGKKKLFVGNFFSTVTEDDLRGLFESHGTVLEVVLVTDRASGHSRGFGFVTMATEKEAWQAMLALGGKELEGRPLEVHFADEQK